MAITYVPLINVTVGAGGSLNIEFTSINTYNSSYDDLLILLSPRGDAASSVRSVTFQVNGSTSGYSDKRIYGSGATVATDGNVYGTDEIYVGEAAASGGTVSTWSSMSIYIPKFAGSSYKTFSIDSVSEQASSTAYAQNIAGVWSSTSGITSIKFIIQTGNFAQYSTATLYGIKKA